MFILEFRTNVFLLLHETALVLYELITALYGILLILAGLADILSIHMWVFINDP